MSDVEAKRVVLIGLDGLVPELMTRYAPDIPEFRRLRDEGFFAPAIPSLPTDTPTNWTTIATGAWAGTHGHAGFAVHRPGQVAGTMEGTFNSRLCQAEYVWQAAERQGKRSILINYPLAFPISMEKGIAVGGDGLTSKDWTVRWPELFSSREEAPRANRLEMQEPEGWVNVPEDCVPLAETVLKMQHQGTFNWSAAGMTHGGTIRQETYDLRHVLIVRDAEGLKVALSTDKDWHSKLALLSLGKWSGWIRERLGGRECFRQYKVIKLSENGRTLDLYATRASTPDGWTFPAELADELVANVGPYCEGLELEADSAIRKGWISFDEHDDLADVVDIAAAYIVECASYLSRREDWDLMMIKIHAPDPANHIFLGMLEDPDPYKRSVADKALRDTYALLFRMVDGIMRNCVDDQTAVLVVSDHGNIPIRYWVNAERIMIEEGWTVYRQVGESGAYALDPAASKAWLSEGQPGIYVNLKGRQDGGIVEPGEEYERLRDAIVNRFRKVTDPAHGDRPVFSHVGNLEAFMGFGAWGERFPDVLCTANPYYLFYPYSPKMSRGRYEGVLAGDYVMPLDEAPISKDIQNLSAVHWTLPGARSEVATNRGCFLLWGPGVARGKGGRQVNLVDAVPTICHMLGIEPTKQCEGRIVHEAFAADA